MIICKNCGNEIKYHKHNNYGWRHEEGLEPPMNSKMEICGKPEPKGITRRMRWIVQMLKKHPGAYIRHFRDAFLEKSSYVVENPNDAGMYFVVTNRIVRRMAELKLIEIIEERTVTKKDGTFVTTERDYGLPH